MTLLWQQDEDFKKVIKQVLVAEGGYVNHPSDPGGPTKYGIAYNYNQGILKKFGIYAGNMVSLTKEQAIEIYYIKYWLASRANTLPDLRLQAVHFDCAVNQGVGQAAKYLEQLSTDPDYYEGDGKNEALWLKLCQEYIALRLLDYTRYKGWQSFLRGWVNRMAHLLQFVSKQ